MKIEPTTNSFTKFKEFYNKHRNKDQKEQLSKNKTKIKSSVDSPTKIKEDDNIIGWA
jgi:hypothetical protein